MVVQERLMTVEEFWEQYADKPYELVRGRVIEVSPSGFEASATAAIVIGVLHLYLRENPLGVLTGADGGYQLARDTLRAPDAAFVSSAKLKQLTDPVKFAPFAPDFVVEVVSPGNSALEIQEKIALYFEAGVRLAWVMYPNVREVVVHLPDRTARTFGMGDTLDGGDVLPGFRVALADLFPASSESPA